MIGFRILCVDDEQRSLTALEALCKQQNPINEVYAFSGAEAALEFALYHNIDIALIDIDMPVMNGIVLTEKLQKINPRLNVIITTAYEQYALDAYRSSCSGYLLKPIKIEDLQHQFSVLRFPLYLPTPEKDIRIRCFGNFEAYYKNEPIVFAYNKTKELLAYLTDREGSICSNGQIMAVLWEDDENHTSYLKQIKKDLSSTFARINHEDIFSVSHGFIGLKPDAVSCDYYDFTKGDHSQFKGEYMEQYSWAEVTKSNLLYQMEK